MESLVANPIILAFITGLTTGGLSCLAVQGGLLAASLAHQIEKDMLNPQPAPAVSAQKRKTKQKQYRSAAARSTTSQPHTTARPNTAGPILLFLLAKIIAYTLLGALLGWVGSFLAISPLTRAIMLVLIGIFMIGNGLRILNVHPIFRYFNLEPPKFLTRYIRRLAKNNTDAVTPLFLGALTVFIPCGVTQAMMAAALATGSALASAAMMFAFTLGTSVLFFVVAYFTTQLGARLEKYFMTFVAVVVLIFGLITVNSGLNLMGSPLSYENITRSLFSVAETPAVAGSGSPAETGDEASASTDDGRLLIQATNRGYTPDLQHARAGQAYTLSIVTENTVSCARDFVIPSLDYYVLLPTTGEETVEIPPQEPGSVLRYTCSMGMYTGQIVFDN
jgi:uncharacterized protein